MKFYSLQKPQHLLYVDLKVAPFKEQFEEHKKAAEDAQSMGDEEACQSHAQKALLLLRKSDKDGEAGTD